MFNFRRISLIPALVATLSLVGTAWSQGAQLRLLGLAVEGNEGTDPGLIVATSGLLVGEPLTGDKVQTAIRLLWKLDLFSDIKLVVERETEEGLYLLIRVREYPRLEAVDIVGGKKIGKGNVEEAIDLHKGQVLKPSEPVRLRRNLQKLCEDKGYLLTKLDIEIREGSTEGLATLHLRIQEGEKVKIKDIMFEGNESFSDRKLRKQLEKTHRRALFRSGEFKRDEFDEDLDRLTDFYREHGRRDAQVLGDSIWYSDNLRRMFIRVNLEEGAEYYFGDVTFSGSELFSDGELRSQLLFKPGEVFNQKRYGMSLERLGSMYYDRGYIYARIQPTEVPAGGDTLDVHVQIEEGNRFSVRNINITGNTKTREKVIRREFVLKPGDTFDVSRLRRSIREVAILNYFADIQPDIEEVGEDEVDLWIKVEERPTDQANLSAGYSEMDGLIGAIGFAAPNLFGTGQRLSLDWNFGQKYGSFSVSYVEPYFLDTETLVGGSFYNVRRRWADGFTERLVGGSVSLGRRFRWPDDYFRGDWIYRVERSRYTEFSSDLMARIERGEIQMDSEPRLSSSITQVITRDSRDLPEFPSTGSVYSLTTELAGGPLTGVDRYHKHIFSAEWYSPLASKLVLYNQMLCGYMDALTDDRRDIPFLEYFYMGGSGLTLGTPLRGYDERSVGPRAESGGAARGGKSQLKFTAELRVQLVEQPTIYGLAFAEAGNTWLNFQQADPFDLRRSVGLGIRLYMPMIGLIGLDYGYGMDPDASGRRPGWTPHFQFGRHF